MISVTGAEKKCLIVGHSYGGYAALEVAHRQPEIIV